MTFKNTTMDYGLVAKTFHWLTAILFLGSYISVYYRHWFTEQKTPENWLALQTHLSIGITIGVVVLLRVIWKLSTPSPRPEPGTAFQHALAKTGHIALYAVMIIMPITGYLGTGVDTEYFSLFNITGIVNTPFFDGDMAAFKAFEKPFDLIHKEVLGEGLLLVLIGGHIAAALYHHFVKKDRTLIRMTHDKHSF
jgi:cytochrome b561